MTDAEHPLIAVVAETLSSSGGARFSEGAVRKLTSAYAEHLRSLDAALEASELLIFLAAVLHEQHGLEDAAHTLRGLVLAADPQLATLEKRAEKGRAQFMTQRRDPLTSGARPAGTTPASPLARFALSSAKVTGDEKDRG